MDKKNTGKAPGKKSYPPFCPWKKLPNGKTIYAKDYGKKAFPMGVKG